MQLYFWNTKLDLSTGIRLGLNCRKRILGLWYGVCTSVCLICLCDVLHWSQCTSASSNACSLHRTSLTAWQLADSQRTKPRFSYINLSLRHCVLHPTLLKYHETAWETTDFTSCSVICFFLEQILHISDEIKVLPDGSVKQAFSYVKVPCSIWNVSHLILTKWWCGLLSV